MSHSQATISGLLVQVMGPGPITPFWQNTLLEIREDAQSFLKGSLPDDSDAFGLFAMVLVKQLLVMSTIFINK